MQHNIEPTQGPWGFLISFIVMLFTQAVPNIATTQQWHVPPFLMELSQTFAWWCVAGTFVITVLNFLGLNPFKKKK